MTLFLLFLMWVGPAFAADAPSTEPVTNEALHDLEARALYQAGLQLMVNQALSKDGFLSIWDRLNPREILKSQNIDLNRKAMNTTDKIREVFPQAEILSGDDR